jgi:hypothetical protein
MTGHNLPENYTDILEAVLMKSRSCTASSFATPPTVEPVTTTPSATTAMAKFLCDYSTLAIANVLIGLAVNTGTRNFELCTGLITIV